MKIVIWGQILMPLSIFLLGQRTHSVSRGVCVCVRVRVLRAQSWGLGDITPTKPVFLLAALPKTRFNGNSKCWGSKRLDSVGWFSAGETKACASIGRKREKKNICLCSSDMIANIKFWWIRVAQSTFQTQQVYGNCVSPILTSCETQSHSVKLQRNHLTWWIHVKHARVCGVKYIMREISGLKSRTSTSSQLVFSCEESRRRLAAICPYNLGLRCISQICRHRQSQHAQYAYGKDLLQLQ